MTLPAHDSVDQILLGCLDRIRDGGAVVSPRGDRTREILSYGFCLRNPRARLVFNSARKWSLAFALGEFCWHSSGSDQVDQIAHYASAWRAYSKDGKRVGGSCYGYKIFSAIAGDSQWDALLRLLKMDPASRRAILYFNDGNLESHIQSVDVSCTNSCQFFIRSGQVHALVSMRSNDVILGLPYDVFFFTMLQERLAVELGLELGSYNHVAGSMHLYERHYELARDMLAANSFDSAPMPPMSDVRSLPRFLASEAEIRRTGTLRAEERLNGYWGDLQDVLLFCESQRPNRRLSVARVLDAVPNPYRPILATRYH